MGQFSTRLLALIPLAVGINLAMGQFVAVLHLPLFLDTVDPRAEPHTKNGQQDQQRADGEAE